MRKVLAFVASMLLAIAPAFGREKGLTKQEDKAWKSTFELYIRSEGQIAGACTATAVKKVQDGYVLITAGHCVEDKPGIDYVVAEEVTNPPFKTQPVQLISYHLSAKCDESDPHCTQDGRHLDVAFFFLKSSKDYPVIEIKPIQEPALESKVFVVHFAQAFGKQVSRGVVSSYMLTDGAAKGHCQGDNDVCTGNFVVQLYAGSGASGSLVMNKKGQPIGILIGGFEGGYTIEPVGKFYFDYMNALEKCHAVNPKQSVQL
jgi:hypothetical protein